jgi:hypothetical protein
MQIVHSDSVFRVDPGSPPDYNTNNPLLRLLSLVEQTRPIAEHECYEPDSLQYLLPLSWLQLYGPSPPNTDQLDPTQQDVKTDFQKQNVRDFHLADSRAIRGWANTGAWRGPFVQLSYRAGPDSALAQAAQLGNRIGCNVSIPGGPQAQLQAAYDPASARYVIELWGLDAGALRGQLGPRGQAAFDAGLLTGRPDLIRGGGSDFDRGAVDSRDMRGVSAVHAMHPILPLYLDVRWSANPDGSGAGDPAGGAAMRFGFEMLVRGWNNFLRVGTSPNPHGGVGFLEYRNLFSTYGDFAGSPDLVRRLEPWNFDAFGHKGHASGEVEPFFAVEYMDLHVLEGGCGIGLHRHRDNQEVFLCLDGPGWMIVGDWADSGSRARAFEVRRLVPGQLAMLKGGNLHAYMNPSEFRSSLFMFGGYD